MNGVIMAIQLLLGLSIIIFIHELGHYLAARMFGIRVDKFYLFFDAWGYKLFSFKIGDTEYGMGWLPLGGYCKIAGMVDESLDKKSLKNEPKPYEYRSKPAWQRLIVITAGVIMNLLFGIMIFALLIMNREESYIPLNEVNKYGIYANDYARSLGFKNGDKIIEINGKSFTRFRDIQDINILFGSDIKVERDGEEFSIQIPDTAYRHFTQQKENFQNFFDLTNYTFIIDTVIDGYPAKDAGIIKGDKIIAVNNIPTYTFGDFKNVVSKSANDSIKFTLVRSSDTLILKTFVNKNGLIGVISAMPYKTTDYSFLSALYYGNKDAFSIIISNAKGLGKIVTGEEKASESIKGPIGISAIYGGEFNWLRFWNITAIISLVLAFMNILPIPGLDGGHMIFNLFELITGIKPSDKVLGGAQIVGMILLFSLMFFAIGNDIINLFR